MPHLKLTFRVVMSFDYSDDYPLEQCPAAT